jgi:hypothetical protein
MDRLEFVSLVNPTWCEMVKEFVQYNPIFYPWIKYTAATPNPTIPEEALKNIRDTFLYYVSYAGVNTNYGDKVWEWVKKGELHALTEKKRTVIQSILTSIPEDDSVITVEQINKLKISGVGEGAKSFVRQFHFHTQESYETDRIFLSGLKKIYNLDKKPTTKEARKITSEWIGNKQIGTSFCFQVANYG